MKKITDIFKKLDKKPEVKARNLKASAEIDPNKARIEAKIEELKANFSGKFKS